jgi:hypothetical protein
VLLVMTGSLEVSWVSGHHIVLTIARARLTRRHRP